MLQDIGIGDALNEFDPQLQELNFAGFVIKPSNIDYLHLCDLSTCLVRLKVEHADLLKKRTGNSKDLKALK
jgi:hypothetical protein